LLFLYILVEQGMKRCTFSGCNLIGEFYIDKLQLCFNQHMLFCFIIFWT